MEQVKLLAALPSPFTFRVICALKLKGIEYEYVAEDLFNKSALLLQYNPVHKKIPVLVHAGKPIAESMVIVEYIDETWPGQYPLLPKDPHERSVARFWTKFIENKSMSLWSMLFRTTGDDTQEKAIKDCLEFLRSVEDYALGEKKFFGGDVIGIADLALGSIAYWLGVIEEIVGVKLLDENAFPRLHAYIENFKGVPIIKENLPDHDELSVFLKGRREMMLAMASQSK